MNEFTIGSDVYVNGGDWEGMTGILAAVGDSTCTVALGMDLNYKMVDLEHLEIIVNYSDLEN